MHDQKISNVYTKLCDSAIGQNLIDEGKILISHLESIEEEREEFQIIKMKLFGNRCALPKKILPNCH